VHDVVQGIRESCQQSALNQFLELLRTHAIVQWLACSTTGREVVGSSLAGRGPSRSNRGPVAVCTQGMGLLSTQPSILSGSVNEYRLRLGNVKGRYVRRCLVRAMHLSAPEVALSTWGAITNVELCLLPFFATQQGSCSLRVLHDYVFDSVRFEFGSIPISSFYVLHALCQMTRT